MSSDSPLSSRASVSGRLLVEGEDALLCKLLDWLPASPGTGGNLSALAFSTAADVLWTGSDNGGMMRGTRAAGTGLWDFSGAHRGLKSKTITDVFSIQGFDGSDLTYAVADENYGPQGIADERNTVFRRVGGAAMWEPLPFASCTHVWAAPVPPTGVYTPSGDAVRLGLTGPIRLTVPSFVRILPLSGDKSRHLIVAGGTSTDYKVFKDGAIKRDNVTPRRAPNFYACLARVREDGTTETGPWVGATYLDQYAAWPKPNGPGNVVSGVVYTQLCGVGSLWLDPTLQAGGTEAHLYFTFRIELDTGVEDHVARLSVRLPAGDSLELPLPETITSPRTLSFVTIHKEGASPGVCQVAGVRIPDAPFHLVVTGPSVESTQAVRVLVPPAGGATTAPWTIQSDGFPQNANLFFCRSNSAGYVYVACAPMSSTVVPKAVWARAPKVGGAVGGTWKRCTFITGAGAFNPPNVDLVGSNAALLGGPVQVAVGYAHKKDYEGGVGDVCDTYVVVRWLGANSVEVGGTAQSIHPAYEPGELIAGWRWQFVELPLVPGAQHLSVLIYTRSSKGAGIFHIRARRRPVSSCPLASPLEWTQLVPLSWAVGSTEGAKQQAKAAGITVVENAVDGPAVFLDLTGALTHSPNMNRLATWRGQGVNHDGILDAFAVLADPSGGDQHRIAIGRQSSELYVSEDNGDTFVPLGCESAGISSPALGALAERWATTGLETMTTSGFYMVPDAASSGVLPAGRVFTFTNDGGLFMSDDGGASWFRSQRNVANWAAVPPAPYSGASQAAVGGSFIGGPNSAIVDVTAMAARRVDNEAHETELLLALSSVDIALSSVDIGKKAGRVVTSTDGGWSWTDRTLCGLPSGAIWSMVEASPKGWGAPVYAAVVGGGVYYLPAGATKWVSTGPFRWKSPPALTAGMSSSYGTIPQGFEVVNGEARPRLNVLRLLRLPGAGRVPAQLVAAVAVDGVNSTRRKESLLPQTHLWCGLYRLALASDGLPAKGASWEQFAGPAFPLSFPQAWRFPTGLAPWGKLGLVASVSGYTVTGYNDDSRWVEGGVLYCEDVTRRTPVFRLVLAHPHARAVTTTGTAHSAASQRLFVALGSYERIRELNAKNAAPVWTEWSNLWPNGNPSGVQYEPDRVYHHVDTLPSKPAGPVGVFEIRAPAASLSLPDWTLDALLGQLETVTGLQARYPLTSSELAEELVDDHHKGGYLGKLLTLADLTGSVSDRNLLEINCLQAIGDSLFLGLYGSGGWVRPIC